jgi:hypothetical protein
VPPPFGAALYALAVALLAVETWQLATPCLALLGLRGADAGGGLGRDPVALATAALLALATSVSVLLLELFAVRCGETVLAAQSDALRRRWTGAMAAGAALLAAGLAWSVTAQRGPASAHAQATSFLVALAVPLAALWLASVAHRLAAERAAARARAQAWNLDHHRSLSEVSRRAADGAELHRQLLQLEAQRATALQRARDLERRVALVDRIAADAIEGEEQDLAQAAQGIVAALEQDRFEYVRQAGGRPALRPAPGAAMRPPHDDERNLGLAG